MARMAVRSISMRSRPESRWSRNTFMSRLSGSRGQRRFAQELFERHDVIMHQTRRIPLVALRDRRDDSLMLGMRRLQPLEEDRPPAGRDEEIAAVGQAHDEVEERIR